MTPDASEMIVDVWVKTEAMRPGAMSVVGDGFVEKSLNG